MKISIAVLVLFAAAAVAGVAQPQLARSAAPAPTTPKTITVTGSGSVETVPDRATFSFTVTTLADTAKAALAKNSASTDAVVAALKGAKVQTSGLGVDPRFDEKGTTIVGYTASTTVSADAPLAQMGGLIDAAVAAGADGVAGPSFSRSDQDALYKQALKDAVANAHAKAAALADAGGVSLGDVQTMTEGSSVSTPLPVAMASDAKIEPGTQTISATVTVTYAAG